MSEHFVSEYFVLGHKIGNGSFGEVFTGTDIRSGNKVAIKFELPPCNKSQLCNERNVYASTTGSVGIPTFHWFGEHEEYNALVMELLGPSLEDLFFACNRHFSLKTIIQLTDQMLRRVQCLHKSDWLHRDIKPDNFAMGIDEFSSTVYLFDFGLAKRFCAPLDGIHIPFKKNKKLAGTARYVSIHTHMGLEQSRRDDLEALGYVLLYFNLSALPWQGLKAKTRKQKYERIAEIKLSTPLTELCKGCPREFHIYLRYCRDLGFSTCPDYEYLIKLFHGTASRWRIVYNWVFDWTNMKNHSVFQESRKDSITKCVQNDNKTPSQNVYHNPREVRLYNRVRVSDAKPCVQKCKNSPQIQMRTRHAEKRGVQKPGLQPKTKQAVVDNCFKKPIRNDTRVKQHSLRHEITSKQCLRTIRYHETNHTLDQMKPQHELHADNAHNKTAQLNEDLKNQYPKINRGRSFSNQIQKLTSKNFVDTLNRHKPFNKQRRKLLHNNKMSNEEEQGELTNNGCRESDNNRSNLNRVQTRNSNQLINNNQCYERDDTPCKQLQSKNVNKTHLNNFDKSQLKKPLKHKCGVHDKVCSVENLENLRTDLELQHTKPCVMHDEVQEMGYSKQKNNQHTKPKALNHHRGLPEKELNPKYNSKEQRHMPQNHEPQSNQDSYVKPMPPPRKQFIDSYGDGNIKQRQYNATQKQRLTGGSNIDQVAPLRYSYKNQRNYVSLNKNDSNISNPCQPRNTKINYCEANINNQVNLKKEIKRNVNKVTQNQQQHQPNINQAHYKTSYPKCDNNEPVPETGINPTGKPINNEKRQFIAKNDPSRKQYNSGLCEKQNKFIKPQYSTYQNQKRFIHNNGMQGRTPNFKPRETKNEKKPQVYNESQPQQTLNTQMPYDRSNQNYSTNVQQMNTSTPYPKNKPGITEAQLLVNQGAIPKRMPQKKMPDHKWVGTTPTENVRKNLHMRPKQIQKPPTIDIPVCSRTNKNKLKQPQFVSLNPDTNVPNNMNNEVYGTKKYSTPYRCHGWVKIENNEIVEKPVPVHISMVYKQPRNPAVVPQTYFKKSCGVTRKPVATSKNK
ncbi:metacaspase-2 isoform X2 [Teleopsis dalmanni]|uniref:metacaspase-2 isoform X2 n=1 Tax=Teleopsis dalmanni TaxID=139649 RepID=UPI0018CDC85F|nr:metacaspase-2 isoform X2 [Teleopsis dalmanni]